ncbi:flavin reductase family protein [Methanosphaera sp. WGK6]|uniref:flavin reductase family protein n=1 Tax=Methanosphaera sp. WGK6 TaxID=1561964 RepID=UPI00084BEE28|nr:flavin reductase family protein [Methanosphaera sp. WGK6]OED30162.1 flavin oxidoreductase [Methanosphaera sp. WGK6]
MKSEAEINKSRIEPKPNTIISCRKDGKDNALAVGLAANASLEPAMVIIGIVPSRYSYPMIKETGQFVVNIPAKNYADEFMYLGTVSGTDEDKLANLNTCDADIIDAPILIDCPVNFECTVIDSITPENGTHELFIGKIEKVHCDKEYLEDGLIQWDKIDLL